MGETYSRADIGRSKATAVQLATELTNAELVGKIDWSKVVPFLMLLLQQLLPLFVTIAPKDEPDPQPKAG